MTHRNPVVSRRADIDAWLAAGVTVVEIARRLQCSERGLRAQLARWRAEKGEKAGKRAEVPKPEPVTPRFRMLDDEASEIRTLRPSPISRSLYWGEVTDWGWERFSVQDHVEIVTDEKGREREVHHYDPGIAYPKDWDGLRYREGLQPIAPSNPERGVRGWIITGCQDRTPVHGPAFTNLYVYAQWLGYELIVGQATYARDWYYGMFDRIERTGRPKKTEVNCRPWAAVLDAYMTSELRELTPDLWHCADVNILPTARRPCTGLLQYGKGRSTIFTHPRQDLESVPRLPPRDPIVAMTTGYVTTPNYVDRKAGRVARFHHIIGALIVEVDADGQFFARHLHCDARDGSFHDLDRRVDRGVITDGHRVPGIVYGDAHVEHLDPLVGKATWGWRGWADDMPLADKLRPRVEFYHDTLDFWARNHHRRDDPWHGWEVSKRGVNVIDEVQRAAEFLARQAGFERQAYVVESNHDLALSRWLRETNPLKEPGIENAELHLEASLYVLRCIRDGKRPDPYPWLASRFMHPDKRERITWLAENASILVEGVECGQHGHAGANGARGSTSSHLAVAGRMVNADCHSPTKREGLTRAGQCMSMDPMPSYARRGATSWAHAHVVIYPGGRTTLVFVNRGRWRALDRPRHAAAMAA